MMTKKDNTAEILAEIRAKKIKFVTDGGLRAQSEMIARCPVASGNLRASIETEADGSGEVVYSDTGPTANYAEFVEYGTSNQKAQPYAEPGWQAALTRIDSLGKQVFTL